ncbi:hypothetical protein [Bacillus arachidis]|uniref:Uncharacterized protein n=1 Tax=Bacillus arachidis TaxID=2819290 RepID=A0ABS3P1G7_9BACI|nr:hypothetical protein [Bacillus arachidis]MBO1627034.1 hypothetical protein [Bacillus arachidis]
MNKLKWGSRIIFCLLAISACLLLAIGITKGVFFAKEQVLDSSQSKVGGDSELLYDNEDLPDFDKDGYGYYTKENYKGIPRDRKVPIGGEEFLDVSTENIFIQIGILVLVMLIIFFIFRRMRNKKQEIHLIDTKQKEIRKVEGNVEQEDQDSLILPIEEVRAMLIKWEMTLPKFEKRRLQETMQQWFSRIHKGDPIIPIYEKVRYGEETASNEELQMMRRWIHENVKKSL